MMRLARYRTSGQAKGIRDVGRQATRCETGARADHWGALAAVERSQFPCASQCRVRHIQRPPEVATPCGATSSSVDGCDGNLGLFGSRGDPHRIDLCEANHAIIRHELIHAWERHEVTDEQRLEYLDLFGLTAWFDTAIPHDDRGVEHAANIVGWALQGRPLDALDELLLADLLEGYKILTGSRSPRLEH